MRRLRTNTGDAFMMGRGCQASCNNSVLPYQILQHPKPGGECFLTGLTGQSGIEPMPGVNLLSSYEALESRRGCQRDVRLSSLIIDRSMLDQKPNKVDGDR